MATTMNRLMPILQDLEHLDFWGLIDLVARRLLSAGAASGCFGGIPPPTCAGSRWICTGDRQACSTICCCGTGRGRCDPQLPRHRMMKNTRLVLSACCVAMLSVGDNSTAVMAALPAMTRDLHLDSAAVEWVVNAYLLVAAVFILLGGEAADRFGARGVPPPRE